jgi:hypothetical protein
MIKFLFFTIVFFFLVRYINRLFLPSNKRQNSFDPFRGGNQRKNNEFENLEEAEYEDLSNKDK